MRNETRKAGGSELVRMMIGAVAGTVATGPMTAAMILLHRRLPSHERYPLPPREITMHLAEAAGLKDKMSPAGRYAATLVSHFSYGTAVGAIYGAVERFAPGRPEAKGLLYGLLVWAGSYLGLLPIVGALKSATEHPVRRSALMIGAHLVWGLVLAALVEVLADEASAAGPQPLSSRFAELRDTPA